MSRSCRIDFRYRKQVSLFRDEGIAGWEGFACSTILNDGGPFKIAGGKPPLLVPDAGCRACCSDEIQEQIAHISKRLDACSLYFESRLTRKNYLFCDGEEARALEQGLICGCSTRMNGVPCSVQLAFNRLDESAVLCALSLFEEFVDHVLLEKEDIIPTDGDLVFSERASGIFIHEFIGHSLERDNYRHSWLSKGCISSDLNVFENRGASDAYDDLGEAIPQNLPILKNGKVLNLMDSGNYRVSFFDNPFPGIRMRDMRVGLGVKAKEDLIEETAKGVLVEEIDDGEIDHATGEISFNIRKSRLIENGELCDHLSPFAFFANISELGCSLLEFGRKAIPSHIACGKGGSLVVVGVESPAMKLHSFERVGRCG